MGQKYYTAAEQEQNPQKQKELYADAFRFFKKAAKQGDSLAQHNVGAMYFQGQGVEQSYKKTQGRCQKAAAQGNVDALYNLGLMYVRGIEVEQSDEKATEWLRKAAEKGDARALLFSLGHVEKNLETKKS